MADKRKTRWIITEVRDSKGNIIKDHPWQIASVNAAQPVVIYSGSKEINLLGRTITIQIKISGKPKKGATIC